MSGMLRSVMENFNWHRSLSRCTKVYITFVQFVQLASPWIQRLGEGGNPNQELIQGKESCSSPTGQSQNSFVRQTVLRWKGSLSVSSVILLP